MIQYLREKIKERYNNLSPVLKEALSSDETSALVQQIGTEEGFSPKSREGFAHVIGYTLLGFIKMRDFIDELQEDAQLDRKTAVRVAKKVHAQLFMPIRDEMMRVYGGTFDLGVSEQQEVPGQRSVYIPPTEQQQVPIAPQAEPVPQMHAQPEPVPAQQVQSTMQPQPAPMQQATVPVQEVPVAPAPQPAQETPPPPAPVSKPEPVQPVPQPAVKEAPVVAATHEPEVALPGAIPVDESRATPPPVATPVTPPPMEKAVPPVQKQYDAPSYPESQAIPETPAPVTQPVQETPPPPTQSTPAAAVEAPIQPAPVSKPEPVQPAPPPQPEPGVPPAPTPVPPPAPHVPQEPVPEPELPQLQKKVPQEPVTFIPNDAPGAEDVTDEERNINRDEVLQGIEEPDVEKPRDPAEHVIPITKAVPQHSTGMNFMEERLSTSIVSKKDEPASDMPAPQVPVPTPPVPPKAPTAVDYTSGDPYREPIS